jgi:xanthine dehydrogenase accessory factor
MPGIYSQLAQLVENNKPAAMATVVAGDRLGAKVLVSAEGIAAGSIHEDIDGKIVADALELLASDESKTLTYQVGDEQIEVFIETFPPPHRLIIVGAVHVAIPLHRLAKMLGYYVVVVDARGVLATPERFPVADRLLVEWPDDALATLGLDSSTSVVVLTHDPKFDNPALMAVLSAPVRYIGAIGSRTTNTQRREALRELGATDEQLQRIFAPIGLDIGAKTPAEIALAVMAEIVAARRDRPGGHLKVTKG